MNIEFSKPIGNRVKEVNVSRYWFSFKWLLLALMFFPISLTWDDSVISANYIFVALFFIGYIKAVERWNPIVFIYVLFCIISYILGVLLFSNFDFNFWLRQSISFVIFLLPIFLLFIRVPYTIDDICLAAFWISCLYSLYTLWVVFSHGMLPITDTFYVRSYLGELIPDYPQRFIIIILFSVFYCISRLKYSIWYLPFLFLLLFSVYISFTRSAWLGLGCGFIAYFISLQLKMWNNIRLKFNAKKILKWIIILILIIVTMNETMQEGTILHINRTLDAFVVFLNEPSGFNPQGSEGIRLQIWAAVIDIVMRFNPITGTGFAGIHQFIGKDWGSAHSQLMDILLRTGLLGLVFYLFFWAKILRYYLSIPGIFAGLVALFVFSFSTETTKLSYGALLFFLLLNKTFQISRRVLNDDKL